MSRQLALVHSAKLPYSSLQTLDAICSRRHASNATMFADRLSNNQKFAEAVASSLNPEVLKKMHSLAVRNAAMTQGVERAPMRQLLKTALPYFGIGLFDNLAMLAVGYSFDVTVGVTFGFSTLAAAGVGLAVAQTWGVHLRRGVVRYCNEVGWKEPHRRWETSKSAKTIGILLGCLFGLTPVFLMSPDNPRLFEKLTEFLPPSKRKELLAAMSVVVFNEGDQIVRRGEPSDYLYLVTCGEVEVYDIEDEDVTFLGSLQSGSIFGELGFLLGDPSQIEVVASSFLRTKRLSRKDFFDIMGPEGQEFLHKVETRNLNLPNFLNQSLKHEFTSEQNPRSSQRRSISNIAERAASRLVMPVQTLPTAD